MSNHKAPVSDEIKDPGFAEYPKMLYFKGDGQKQKVVDNAEDEEAAGEDWWDTVVEPAAD